MRKPRADRFRFSLRALLAIPLVVSLLLAWWQMPFTITQTYEDGTFVKTKVRRGWDGVLINDGPRTYFYDNGQKRLEFVLSNCRYKSGCVNTTKIARCWDRMGREISLADLAR